MKTYTVRIGTHGDIREIVKQVTAVNMDVAEMAGIEEAALESTEDIRSYGFIRYIATSIA